MSDLALFNTFVARVTDRLRAGQKRYGNWAFAELNLCEEAEQELFDLVGYTYFLWIKLLLVAEKLEGLRKEAANASSE